MEYIPLQAAAKRYGIEEKVLTQLISAGMIETKAVSGGILVAVDKNGNVGRADEQPQTKEEIIAAKFAHLRGKNISASEASRKYSNLYGIQISNELFSRWSRLGYIKRKAGYRLQLDEAEVAYCAEIFAIKYREYDGRMRGVTVFDAEGNPYQLKYPEVAEQLRIERRQSSQVQ
jgi:hypothetical protein